MMPSAKPTQPPSGADMSALVKRVSDLSVKAGLAPFTSKLPLWKRWVGGEKPEYDGTGLRDVVKTNADFLDVVKTHLDGLDEREANHHAAQAARLTALEEAVAHPPFPG